MISRRSLLATPLLGAFPFGAARAQEYPAHTLTFVVPATAGSASYLTARYISTRLSKDWNQSAIVDNKLGASGNIGIEYVARAPGNGYTLLVAYSMLYTNPFIGKTNYDPVKDFEPIARIANSSLVMATAKDSRFKTVADVIAAAKDKPDSITYASSGIGTASHMCAVLLENLAGIRLRHVPYKSPAQVAQDTASGIVDLGFNGTSTVVPLIQGGRLHAVAVTSAKRSGQLPDTPTLAEAGVKGYDLSSPVWVLAPRGTPPAIVEKLSDAITRIAAEPGFRELCDKQSLDVDIQNTAAYRASVPAEVEKWRQLVALTNASASAN
jgi:tripartite-type tricarboxylate transporter receptor subunit TctC